eukprot:98280_1
MTATPFTATNLTNAAKASHTVQSTLSKPRSKQKFTNELDVKKVASLICIGCFIGYSLNYMYNKIYNNYTCPPYYPKDICKIKSTKQKQKQKQIMANEIKKHLFKYKHSSKRNLLFVPNESQIYGYKQIKQFMDNLNINKLLLIPFGHDNWSENAKYIEMKMWEIGKKSVSIHNKHNMRKTIKECDGIIISNDSNVYKLLYYLYYYNLVSMLQDVINNGKAFIAIGSGINIACLTVQTSFDIPIIMAPTYKALSIIPFQLLPINIEKCDDYDDNLRLFLKENKDYNINVLLLCEDCVLIVQNNKIQLKGNGNGCILYKDYKSEKETIMVGGLLTSLLFNLNK